MFQDCSQSDHLEKDAPHPKYFREGYVSDIFVYDIKGTQGGEYIMDESDYEIPILNV